MYVCVTMLYLYVYLNIYTHIPCIESWYFFGKQLAFPILWGYMIPASFCCFQITARHTVVYVECIFMIPCAYIHLYSLRRIP